MTDRFDDLPSGKIPMPEVIDETYDSILTPEETAFFNDTIFFINATVSAKALEAALLIGNFILTNYFNDDPDLAFSKDSNKPISFNILCEHPELPVSRRKLIAMVKVAAQERYLQTINFNYSKLHYSHLERLALLPNDSLKIEIARECISENLNSRQLGYRIRKHIMEAAPPDNDVTAPDTEQKTVENLFSVLDQLTGKVASLSFDTLLQSFEHLSVETKESLQHKLMTLIDTMDAAETDCENVLRNLQSPAPENRY
jgi:hypothetical protein